MGAGGLGYLGTTLGGQLYNSGGYGNGVGSAAQAAHGGPGASGSAGALTQNALAQLAAYHAEHIAKAQKPLESAGISVGEFVGWRIWRVHVGLLSSYSASYTWLPGQPVGGKPVDHNSEGIWAFKDPHRAANKLVTELGEGALGSVWLWGDVIEHADGYRAEFAEVRSIDLVRGRGAHLSAMHYGIIPAPTMVERVMRRRDPQRNDDENALHDLRATYGVGSAADADAAKAKTPPSPGED